MTTLYKKTYFRTSPSETAAEAVGFIPYESQEDGSYAQRGVDSGPAQAVTRTFTQNDDISTARDISAAPASGQKIVALDVYVSVDTAGYVTIQMETSGNVLAGAYMAANSTIAFTLRGLLKGDAANKKLQVKSSVASKGAVTAVYFSEA